MFPYTLPKNKLDSSLLDVTKPEIEGISTSVCPVHTWKWEKQQLMRPVGVEHICILGYPFGLQLEP